MLYSETETGKFYWANFCGRKIKVIRTTKKRQAFINAEDNETIYYASELTILEEVTENNNKNN